MNEHIGRLQKVGFGKESTAGTAVSATAWIPKIKGAFVPDVTKAKDASAYGTIDELRDSVTVRQMTNINVDGIFRDQYGGHLLLAALGNEYLCLRMTMGSLSGTFQVGETVTQAVSGATGTVRRVDGSQIYVVVASGTFTSGSNTVTGGTSSATGVPTFDNTLRTHVFSRLNSNNHPSFTVYGVDDVGTYRSPYSMLESLELELSLGGFLSFKTVWKGQKEESSSATPAFTTSENAFLAKHANLRLASGLSGLNGAAATKITSVRLTIQKNLEAYQAFGSVDVSSIHNKQFKVAGEITALFNSTTLKDYVLNSTKKALRLDFTNTDATIGSAGNPFLYIDLAQASFQDWKRTDGNDELVMQTLGFEAEFSVTDSESMAMLLQNTKTSVY